MLPMDPGNGPVAASGLGARPVGDPAANHALAAQLRAVAAGLSLPRPSLGCWRSRRAEEIRDQLGAPEHRPGARPRGRGDVLAIARYLVEGRDLRAYTADSAARQEVFVQGDVANSRRREFATSLRDPCMRRDATLLEEIIDVSQQPL